MRADYRAAAALDAVLSTDDVADAILWLLDAEKVGDAELAALAQARGQAIAAALTAPDGLDPSRVQVTDPSPVKRKKEGSDLVQSEMTMDAKD